MAQLSYSINTPAWTYPGQIADNGFKDVLSAIAAAAALPYGLLIVLDSTNTSGFGELCGKLPGSSADITTATRQLGVSLADQARAQDPSVSSAQYPIGAAVPCMKKGRAVVQAETAVTAGHPVYARWASGDNGTVIGAFGGILDSSSVGNALLANAVWMDTTAAAGFAVVEFSIV